MQNQNELFDVVDEGDHVVGQAPRGRVHAEGLRHRAVHILVINSAREVLIQLRSPSKDKHPETWDTSACGHVDAGEDYLTAARRELGEELGLEHVPPLGRIGRITACEETGQEFVEVFCTFAEGPFHFSRDEITEVRWVAPHELEKWMMDSPAEFAPALPYLWKKFAGEIRQKL
jgi:16S rRNA (adenine1518-N6/adenine1519-N6)-dimethyltransferase